MTGGTGSLKEAASACSPIACRKEGNMVKKTAAVLAIAFVSFVTACAPAAPTPTQIPEPTATSVEVTATKAEHMVGIWRVPRPIGVDYFWWDTDGTVWQADSLSDSVSEVIGEFWFEDGVYYEKTQYCEVIGVYEVHLEVRGAKAVLLRMKLIEDCGDPTCVRRQWYRSVFVRVE
jgi:hypothetical protein